MIISTDLAQHKIQVVFFTDMNGTFWHSRPLGAYRLASELRNYGYEVLVIDFFSKWIKQPKKLHELLQLCLSDHTLFVGYSGTFFSRDNGIKTRSDGSKDYYESYYRGGHADIYTQKQVSSDMWPEQVEKIFTLNQYIKKLAPKAKIFYGGAKSNMIDRQLEESGVDFVVQGFADSVIPDIMSRLAQNKNPVYDVNFQPSKLRVINHDILSTQLNFSKTTTRFHASDCVEPYEVMPLETSRGCLFKCKFCSYPLLGRKKNDPDYHKHKSVVEDELLRNYYDFGITKYMIIDDTFNESTEKLVKIYESVQKTGLNLEFSCYLRLDLLARYPEQMKLLYDMGMKSCFLGIETLNPASARAIGKSSEIHKVKNTLSQAKEIWGQDVVVYGSFICGLPRDTEQTINEWMQWVWDNSEILDSFNINTLGITRLNAWASEIDQDPAKFGYTFEDGYWINDQGLTQQRAMKLADEWMEKSWTSGRLKVTSWEMMGIQNLGYSFKQLRQYTLDKLPWEEFTKALENRVIRYQNRLLTYLGHHQGVIS